MEALGRNFSGDHPSSRAFSGQKQNGMAAKFSEKISSVGLAAKARNPD
jgi:hypothetical protein